MRLDIEVDLRAFGWEWRDGILRIEELAVPLTWPELCKEGRQEILCHVPQPARVVRYAVSKYTAVIWPPWRNGVRLVLNAKGLPVYIDRYSHIDGVRHICQTQDVVDALAKLAEWGVGGHDD